MVGFQWADYVDEYRIIHNNLPLKFVSYNICVSEWEFYEFVTNIMSLGLIIGFWSKWQVLALIFL